MKITAQQIRRACPNVYNARLDAFVRTLNQWGSLIAGLDTPLRIAHYLAQVMHESGQLRWTEELASGQAYEGRKDLGNTKKGDGVRFKGRGYLQTTGRANYQAYADSEYCVGDLMSHPEWLAQSPGDQKSSLFYWACNGLNRLADQDDIETVTRRINGGTNGLAQRKYFLRRFKKEFGL